MKTKARRYFRYHFNYQIARMRSVPACYPNVDLNTTEHWFENFHFYNLLSFVKAKTWEKPGSHLQVWHDFTSDALRRFGCWGRPHKRREKRKRDGERKPPRGGCDRAGPQLLCQGVWLHLQETEGKPIRYLFFRWHQQGSGATPIAA